VSGHSNDQLDRSGRMRPGLGSKANLAQSTYNPGPPQRVRPSKWNRGKMALNLQLIVIRARSHWHIEGTARFDGKECPSPDCRAVSRGTHGAGMQTPPPFSKQESRPT